jgi:hypothetical protein
MGKLVTIYPSLALWNFILLHQSSFLAPYIEIAF